LHSSGGEQTDRQTDGQTNKTSTNIHTYAPTHTYIHTLTSTHTRTSTHARARTHTHTHTHTHTATHTYTYTNAHTCTLAHTHTHTRMLAHLTWQEYGQALPSHAGFLFLHPLAAESHLKIYAWAQGSCVSRVGRTINICIYLLYTVYTYGLFGWEITKYTVIYGIYTILANPTR